METNPQPEPNRLINEKSPYLLQHAYNPVDWYPWSQEALDKAKAENKPIFLSIGYASCHWCHVMEKECFEDPQVANLLNGAFVCIKVDREERPDLDAQYMAVCQAMGRNCGWPLNVFLTPQLNPFFVASYIPKHSRFSILGMLDLVAQVMQMWRLRKTDLEIVGADIKSRLEAQEKRTPQNLLDPQVIQAAYEELAREFDPEHGGFGRFGFAPKFPRPHSLMFLLRYWQRTGEKNALAMVEKTMREIRLGGIFDQVGFGFHRYSTDAEWLVPHFEKMLYDQALLALVYVEAFQATAAPKFKVTAKETLDYVLRDLAAPEGGFYGAQDADSEGQEGKFYVWTMQEVLDALEPADADLAMHLFGLQAEGNYLEAGHRNGKNILHLAEPLQQIAEYKGLTINELIAHLGTITTQLFETRKKRTPPATDQKVLTDWNGLFIAALAKASVILGARYLQAAQKTADFFLTQMFTQDGTLFHRYAKGERAIAGFLDDYAFLAFGLIELYQASFEQKYLDAANQVTKAMIERFWDTANGGFFFTANQPDSTLPRMKQAYDGAYPSGNSVALHNLAALSRLLNEPTYMDKAVQIGKVFAHEVEDAPQAFTFLLSAFGEMLGPAYSLILVGDPKTDLQEMLNALRKHYLPNVAVSVKSAGQAGLGYEQLDGKATAYVCRDQTCLPPTNSVVVMLGQLGVEQGNVKSP